MRFGFFFHEAVRALTRNAVPSFAAMATVLVTVLVLGVFIPVVQATTGAANEVRSRVIADVYLQSRTSSPADVERVRGIIENETPHVERVVYVPKEKAIAAERKAGRGDYYDLLGANPLPDTFRVYPDKPDNISKIRNALAPLSPSGGRTVIDPAIDEVRNREEDTNKILSATRVVKITMALLAVLLCVASILLIANTIRLSLYARRREVEVMKLVGATDWFIRWPFVLEGVLVGALGGILAILLLGVVKVALVDPLAAQFALIAAPDTINFGAADRASCSARRSASRRSAPACRCGASCASELLGSPQFRAVPCSPCPPQDRAAVAGRTSCRSARCSCSLLLAGGIWLGGHPEYLPGEVRDTLVGDDDAQLYDEATDIIEEDYYRKVDRKQLVNKALGSAVESLNDRFSAYFDPKAYKSFEEATEGAFEGVGMNVEEVERGLRILTVFKGSPAAKGGLKPGDEIIAVNGNTLKGASSEQATTRIKGRAGTTVTLTVVTGKEKPREVKLKRARVDVPVVESQMVRPRRPQGRLREARELHLRRPRRGRQGRPRPARQGRQGGRARPARQRRRAAQRGGAASRRSSSPRARSSPRAGARGPSSVFEATGSSISTKIPVAVLVNRESASASEIVTGALQDRDRATVVGTRTFGKGVFQEIKQLSNGGALDITVGEYFTPKGRNLGGGGPKKGAGITPDVKAQDNDKTKRDEALDVAVRTAVRGHA